MYFIDTNIFLEWFLGQENAHDCELLFEKIKSNDATAVCSMFSVYSVLIYLTRTKNSAQAKKFLEFINSIDNIYVASTTLSDGLKILDEMEKTGLDFDDALQHYTATSLGCNAIITFDKDFTKLNLS